MKAVKRYVDSRGLKNCWFAYFGQGVAEYAYYGIPCKPLITADSLFFDSPKDVPSSIDGPVLMSAGVLSGFEFGPGALNPYEQFKRLQPRRLLTTASSSTRARSRSLSPRPSVTFKRPACSCARRTCPAHSWRRSKRKLWRRSRPAVNATMGRALDANGRASEARPYFEKALMLAKTVEPAFQRASVAGLEERLRAAQK